MEMEFHNMMLDIILGPDAASGGMGGSTNAALSLGPRRNPQHGRRRGSQSDRQSTLSPFHALIMEMTTNLAGNTVDYEWGPFITQLLNQSDDTGPPPMPRDNTRTNRSRTSVFSMYRRL